jgi:hypothetical protein
MGHLFVFTVPLHTLSLALRLHCTLFYSDQASSYYVNFFFRGGLLDMNK